MLLWQFARRVTEWRWPIVNEAFEAAERRASAELQPGAHVQYKDLPGALQVSLEFLL